MQISFYVLSERYMSYDATAESTAPAVNAEAVLDFVCRLTETVLKKSENSLVIVDDKLDRLQRLDAQLWTFSPTSFIPHNLILDKSSLADHLVSEESLDLDERANSANSSDLAKSTDSETLLSAPVTLLPVQPKGFDGVVLNLAKDPLPLSNDGVLPERVLEIITPDEISKEQGRTKYRAYRDLGFELVYFPID